MIRGWDLVWPALWLLGGLGLMILALLQGPPLSGPGGSCHCDDRFSRLEARVRELEGSTRCAERPPPPVVYQPGMTYPPGQVFTWDGDTAVRLHGDSTSVVESLPRR